MTPPKLLMSCATSIAGVSCIFSYVRDVKNIFTCKTKKLRSFTYLKNHCYIIYKEYFCEIFFPEITSSKFFATYFMYSSISFPFLPSASWSRVTAEFKKCSTNSDSVASGWPYFAETLGKNASDGHSVFEICF